MDTDLLRLNGYCDLIAFVPLAFYHSCFLSLLLFITIAFYHLCLLSPLLFIPLAYLPTHPLALLRQEDGLDVGQDAALGDGHAGQQLVKLFVVPVKVISVRIQGQTSPDG